MDGKYYKSKTSVEEYIKMAKGVDGQILIERLKEYLPSGALLLELGSGPGTDWNMLKKDYDVVGSDFSNEFLNHLTADNPQGSFLKLDATTLATDIIFEGIYSNKVLHHLNDKELIVSINRQYEILNTKGIICHSFWKGKGSEIFKGLFVNYHSEQTLQDMFEKKFEILVLDCYQEFEHDDSILLIGRKK